MIHRSRGKLLRVFLLLLPLLAAPAVLRAQETQVPLDEAGRVQVIDAPLARRLGLFVDEYPGFVEARLFQTSADAFTLEILVRRGDQMQRERRVLTADEVRELRERVGALARERAPGAGLNQDGRDLLLGQTSLMGLIFYGPAMTEVTGADGSAALGTYMLTAGASFFLPFLLTDNQPVTYGMATLSRYGGSRGALHGLLLHQLATGATGSDATEMAVAILTSVAEGVAGYQWAGAEQMTPGTASAIGLGGDLGLVWGAGTSVLLGVDDGSDRIGGLLALGGSAAGIYGGHRLAASRDYTWGDVGVMYTAGALGAYGAAVATDLLGAQDESPFALAVMLGSAAGAWQADRMVRGRDFTVGQSTLLQLGTLAGGLMGLGVVAMTGSENEVAYLTGSALGAAAGFGLTYGMQSGAAAARSGESGAPLRLRLAPAALLSRPGSQSARPIPFATVEYRF